MRVTSRIIWAQNFMLKESKCAYCVHVMLFHLFSTSPTSRLPLECCTNHLSIVKYPHRGGRGGGELNSGNKGAERQQSSCLRSIKCGSSLQDPNLHILGNYNRDLPHIVILHHQYNLQRLYVHGADDVAALPLPSYIKCNHRCATIV